MKKTARIFSPTRINSNNLEIGEEFSNSVGLRVRYYRERLGLSQDELASRVGAAQQTIQSLESGKIRKSTFLPLIAKELGVDSDSLIFGSEQLHLANTSQSPLMASSRRVPLFSTRDGELIQAYLKDDRVRSPTGKWIAMDYSLPFSESGPRLFALKLELSDEAFQPEFRPGDQLVIDPDAPIQPTDPVIVFKLGTERLNINKYRVVSQSGSDINYELISIHPDFPSFVGSELKSIEILGPVIQMRRPISSRVRLAVLERTTNSIN